MSYLLGMSPIEVQFIRVYVAALRHRYDELRVAIDIMNPQDLGVKDFYTATKVAHHMHKLQADFDAELRELHKKHKTPTRQIKQPPTEDDIVDLFSLSFFKLVTKAKTAADATTFAIPHEGWFSGKPQEWKSSLKTYSDVPTAESALPNILSQYLNFFHKLFNTNKTFDKQSPHSNKKVWPLEQDFFDEYEDNDESDAPDNPFDWLFGDPDDDD